MSCDPDPNLNDCVLIRLPTDTEQCRQVLAAAISMFGPTTDVVLWTEIEPTQQLGELLSTMVQELADRIPAVNIDLVSEIEAQSFKPIVSVNATGDPMRDAEAILNLASVALPERASRELSHPDSSDAVKLHKYLHGLATQRDTARVPQMVPTIAVVAQVQSTFGAVATVCKALMNDDRVTLEIVAIESDHEHREQSTAHFIESLGYQTRDATWLQRELADPASPLATVLFYDPWDDLRPTSARALTVASEGIRIAYIPYGNNVGGGAHIEVAAYNLPVHQIAWRLYCRSKTSRDLFEKHCEAGADHVHVLGMPKLDRVVNLHEINPLTVPAGKATVLWNPHFTFGPEGWSTFDRYLQPMVDYATAHPELNLIIRPHFRLLRDLPLAGVQSKKLIDFMEHAANTLPNVMLDRSADYVGSFAAADAMVSDLSSLISEFALTKKPLCYLHKLDGPGTNADSEYFYHGVVATRWSTVEQFLDDLMLNIDDIRKNLDTGADARRLLVERHFPLEDGQAGARVAREIVDQLLEELDQSTADPQRKAA